MSRSRFRCESIDPTPTRRALLVGIGAGVPLLALMATHGRSFDRAPRAGLSRVGDLVDVNGQPTALALGKVGKALTIEGYYSPAMREGALFDLYERTTAPCMACGLIHDPGPAMSVVGSNAPRDPSLSRPMEIAGRLQIDARGALRLSMG